VRHRLAPQVRPWHFPRGALFPALARVATSRLLPARLPRPHALSTSTQPRLRPVHASQVPSFPARCSFVTTDLNPYYDSFVRWQMDTLHQQVHSQGGRWKGASGSGKEAFLDAGRAAAARLPSSWAMGSRGRLAFNHKLYQTLFLAHTPAGPHCQGQTLCGLLAARRAAVRRPRPRVGRGCWPAGEKPRTRGRRWL
jgi:hypothetical protein